MMAQSIVSAGEATMAAASDPDHADHDQQLGLNIVCEEAAISRPIKPRKKPKKFNKYEKRRAKARLAAVAANKNASTTLQSTQPIHTVIHADNGDDDEGMNATEAEKDEVKNETTNETGIPRKQQQQPSQSEEKADKQSSLLDHASPLQPESQPPLQPSRRVHVETMMQNDAERAKYMAEFHARPMEMDRRSGAKHSCTHSSSSKKESTHLFDSMRSSFELMQEQQPLHPRILSSLTKLGVTQPTWIQTRAIQALLVKRQDKNNNNHNNNLFVQSETGSGKTLAYLLPILQSLAVDATTNQVKQVDRHSLGTRCIILCPTRELASQTALVTEALCKHSFAWIVPSCLSGGEKRKSEKARIRKGVAILICTPGRLLDHLDKTEALLMALKGKLQWLVLDEADRLLDMGLGGQVEQIVQHVLANQPRSGPNKDGVTWNSILVSATVTPQVEELATKMLGVGDGQWLWARGGGCDEGDGDAGAGKMRATATATTTAMVGGPGDTHPGARSNKTESTHDRPASISAELQLAESTPRQLSQLHITVSAKLRLATLVAFLVQRVKRNERTVVFMSTCHGVDYHEALFTSMDSILSGNDNDEDDSSSSSVGIFGRLCPIYKLHGNVPHVERNAILRRFGQGASSSQRSALLLATDVAARGLNLPGVDWTVQYDPPCEVADYAHRAGRTARAGKSGNSLLFLLPSERQFLDVLEMKGLSSLSPLSLTSTLNEAAKICAHLQNEGAKHPDRDGGGGHRQQGNNKSGGRSGEAFCAEIQRRLEECVMEDDAAAKTKATETANNFAIASGGRRRKRKNEQLVSGRLLEMARSAYTSFLCSYPTKEKAVRHIFSARALHLGHVARSFALKEPPKALVRAHARHQESASSIGNGGEAGSKRKHKHDNASLEFHQGKDKNDADLAIAKRLIAKRPKHSRRGEHETASLVDKRVDNKAARALLHERAVRLEQSGMDAM